mgnify:FL=1
MSSILKVSEIQDPTNGNSALTIGSTGIVSQGTPVGFSVALNGGSNQAISNQTYTKAQFLYDSTNTRNFDTHSGWSNSNYYYTVPAGCGGYWMLSAWAEMSDLGTQNLMVISKNTGVGSSGNFLARISEGESPSSTSNTGMYLSLVANLSDGDIVKTEVYHNVGSSANLLEVGNYLRSAMQGWRLG